MQAYNFMSHLQIFKIDKIMVSKYGHLMLPVVFPDKVSFDIPIVKMLLWVLVIYEWLQINFDVNTYGVPYASFLNPILGKVLVS